VVPKTRNGSQVIDDQDRSNRNCGTWVKLLRLDGKQDRVYTVMGAIPAYFRCKTTAAWLQRRSDGQTPKCNAAS
jgi:hypothetical protein